MKNRWKWRKVGARGSQLARGRKVRSDTGELLALVRPEGEVWIWAAQNGSTGYWHRGWATKRTLAIREAEEALNGETSTLARVAAEVKTLRGRVEALNRELRGGK